MLIVARAASQIRSFTRLRSWVIAVSQVLGLSLLFLGLAAGFSLIRFGSIRAGQAWVQGLKIYAENWRIEEDYELKDETKSMNFKIRNISSDPVSILGFRNSCTCTLVDSIPHVIEPNGTIEVNVLIRIDPARSGSKIAGSIWLYANDPKLSEIVFEYVLWPAVRIGIVDQEKQSASVGSLSFADVD